jgi:hypothetical protein
VVRKSEAGNRTFAGKREKMRFVVVGFQLRRHRLSFDTYLKECVRKRRQHQSIAGRK